MILTDAAEMNLAKRLCQFGEIVPQVVNEFRPNILANYLFELANNFHGFYEACPVLKSEEPTRSSRLVLCDLTGRVLKRGLDLLGNQGSGKDVRKPRPLIVIPAGRRVESWTFSFRCEKGTSTHSDLHLSIAIQSMVHVRAGARRSAPYSAHSVSAMSMPRPISKPSPESLHGYDITDHNQLNAAIGSREEYDAWIAELHAHSMGQILDFVPNHMGVMQSNNKWWTDVLENGPSSIYAPYFDIDWAPLKSDLRDKVLLPILTDQYGRVLERGEFQVRFEEGAFCIAYRNQKLPIAPGTYRFILELALENLVDYKDEEFYGEFQSVLTALEHLPRNGPTEPEKLAERAREKEIVKRRLESRCQEAPQVRRAIEKALAQINGRPGDPRSFDKLDELLNAQSYRLAFWRVAAEEINYRRFFDVNDLAAIRMELPEVFDAAHQLVVDLVRTGAVTGLRIDHPDGLYLPKEYLETLQHRSARAVGLPLPKDGRVVYMIVEKILTGTEKLPSGLAGLWNDRL